MSAFAIRDSRGLPGGFDSSTGTISCIRLPMFFPSHIKCRRTGNWPRLSTMELKPTLVNFSGKAQIDCVRFSANGLLAVSVSSLFNDVWGGSVKLFCRQSSGEFMETKHIDLVGGNSSSLLFLKTLKLKEPEILVAASESGDVFFWNCDEEGLLVSPLGLVSGGHDKLVSCITAVGTKSRGSFYSASYDRTIKLWNVSQTKAPLQTFVGHSGPISSVSSCQHNACSLVSGSFDRSILLWDKRQNRNVGKILSKSMVHAVSWDCKYEHVFVSGHGDGSCCMYDTRNPCEPIFKHLSHNGAVCAVSCRPVESEEGGCVYAVGSDDHMVSLFSVSVALAEDPRVSAVPVYTFSALSNPRIARTFGNHTDYVRSLAWSQEGRSLVTAGWDGRVNLFEYKNGWSGEKSTLSLRC